MLIDVGFSVESRAETPLCHLETGVLVPSQKSRVTEEATIRTGRKNHLTLDSPRCSLFVAHGLRSFPRESYRTV